MSGTKAGGFKASRTNKLLHGEDFYKKIGSKGGKGCLTGLKGFALMSREKRVACGKIGGTISRRGKAKKNV